jgi:antitoxin FitA
MTASNHKMLAQRKRSAYGEKMSPNLLVRNIDADIHATLIRRAASEGKSLQEYMTGLLTEFASKPTMAEVMAKIEADLETNPRPNMSTDEIVATIRAVRDA